MPSEFIELSIVRVALAAVLIAVNAGISLALRLGMERTLLLASARTIGQLALLGLILEWVFERERWYVVLLMMLGMTLVAALTVIQRTERRYPGLRLNTVISVWTSSWVITFFTLLAVFEEVEPWYRPQYAIPLLGLLLGNTLNGITLGLNAFLEALSTRRGEVESLLALGATRWEAAREPLAGAVRTGMVPIINSMLVVGLVSLPGIMTGQMLSGTPPAEAVKYQIVVMFIIASATGLGTLLAVGLGYRSLFNGDHQFLHSRITRSHRR